MSPTFRLRCIAVFTQSCEAVLTQKMPKYVFAFQLRSLFLCGLIAVALPSAGNPENHRHDIGRIHFPVSCTPEAQKTFEYGVALVHSFWYDEAEKTFSSVIRVDPACAMAYWGIAMSLYHPLWFPPAPSDLRKGIAAIEKAKSIGAKTQRERDYIAAIEEFYKDSEKVPHRQRAVAWCNAMQRLSARYPEDHEAAIFYALALIATAPPADKTYTNQKHAAAILNPLLPEQPDHPGIAHYLIHSYDSPQLAILALPAARTYAKIAPASPHALHMPSHIFTRLGLWDESIQSNLASAAAAKSQMEKTLPAAISQDQLHAMDYLAYAYLQTCQDEKAKRIVDEAASASRVDQQVFQAAYAFAAIPARYALERRRWSAAAALQVRAGMVPLDAVSLRREHHAFRPCAWLGTYRKHGPGPGRNRRAYAHRADDSAASRGLRLVCASRSSAAYCSGVAQACRAK